MGKLVTVPLRLVHHRWGIPILAELHRQGGARFAALRGHLGVSRDALTSTLAHLIELGLVSRNTGHGHPLRPEYLPTPAGRSLAAPCDALHTQLVDLGLERVGLRKWSLPIVGAVSGARDTFSSLRGALDPITPRALSKSLTDLVDAALLERDERSYALTDSSDRLIEPLLQVSAAFTRVPSQH
ncbi:MAG: winged helix-turn-helix transcriptional regulator [Deltaproteobacteria bacterium]|nr:winged helix-turn-helix transcriptional regulator [Deltaproteobacteria bacterium]